MADYKATPDQWEHEEHWATENSTASCILELRARVQNLEENLGFLTAAVAALEDHQIGYKFNSKSTSNFRQIRSFNNPEKPDSSIVPPPELFAEWLEELLSKKLKEGELAAHIAARSAQWGADQELEACCEWLDRNNQWAQVDLDELREGRRPNPLSIKEQALLAIDTAVADDRLSADVANVVRRALNETND